MGALREWSILRLGVVERIAGWCWAWGLANCGGWPSGEKCTCPPTCLTSCRAAYPKFAYIAGLEGWPCSSAECFIIWGCGCWMYWIGCEGMWGMV